MNVHRAYVTNVLTTPRYYRAGDLEWWIVEIEYKLENADQILRRDLILSSRKQAESVEIGYLFYA